MNPSDLKYTKDHEWIRLSGDAAAEIGITDFAQKQLGDVVYVELPEVGRRVSEGEPFGTIESVKAVSELYSPVNGEVVAVNEAVSTSPEDVNTEPFETWLIKVKVAGAVPTLLTSSEYDDLLKQEG